MYKFKIVIDVEEDEGGLHQNTEISAEHGGMYNRTVALGALEVAKSGLVKEIQKE